MPTGTRRPWTSEPAGRRSRLGCTRIDYTNGGGPSRTIAGQGSRRRVVGQRDAQVSGAVEPPGRQLPLSSPLKAAGIVVTGGVRSSEGMPVLTEEESHAVALNFAREVVVDWDLRGYHLVLSPDLTVGGCFVFGFGLGPDAQGRQRRLSGNWPFVVDARTGACRQVNGVAEHRELRDAMAAGD